jgi:hypothetical protein
MTRGGVYRTVSITSILMTKDRGNMKYLDLKDETTSEMNIGLISSLLIR